jgi:hypothetical protein
MTGPDPLQITRGCIQAPAGCGKTHLIADSLKRSTDQKPILVLTHTNAAVAALRQRLDKGEVPRSNYRLATIDGWAMRMVGMFPMRSKADPSILKLSNPGTDYPAIKHAALRLIQGRHIDEILVANYSRLLVDEYQDCLNAQHRIVCELARLLPTCIFGDVLQGIFDFGDAPVDWNTEVLREFPLVSELSTPWRWNLAGAESLGQWLLSLRPTLLSGGKIDLSTAPAELEWVPIAGDQDFEQILKATNGMPKGIESSLIICSSRNRHRQQQIAQITKGASVVENADLTDLVAFAGRFDFSSADATAELLNEAASVLRGINANEMIARLIALKAGTNRKPATVTELAMLSFDADKTPQKAAALLSDLSNQSGVSAFRGEVFKNLLKALHASANADNFSDMVLKAREERRFDSRALGRKSVGSTLLVKGLEADQAVLVDTHEMNAKNLYVALTRGAKRVVVCSKYNYLPAA